MADRARAYRISRILTVVAVALLAAVLIYAGLAVYFATQIPSPVQGSVTPSITSGPEVVLTTEYTVTNPGPFPLTGVSAVAHVLLPSVVPSLSTGTGTLAIAGYSTTVVPVALNVPMASLVGAASILLVSDVGLPYEVWANGTYAGFLGWHAHVVANYSWGAPFYQFLVDHGVPLPLTNGSVELPLNFSFQDRSPVNLNGSLAIDLLNRTGHSCAALAVQLAVKAGGSYDGSAVPKLPASCAATVSEYLATWTGNDFSAALPEGEVA